MYDFLFGERDPVAEPGTATGTPGNWWTVFALVPDVLDHAVAGFRVYGSKRRQLDPKLRELGMTRAGYARGSQFVFSRLSCRSGSDSPRAIRRDPARMRRRLLLSSLGARARVPISSCCKAGGSGATFATLKEESDESDPQSYTTCLYEMRRVSRTAAPVRRPRSDRRDRYTDGEGVATSCETSAHSPLRESKSVR
jgi:hypothetical protein